MDIEYRGAFCHSLRVHVPKNLVVGILVIVILVQVLVRYPYDCWVLGPLGILSRVMQGFVQRYL